MQLISSESYVSLPNQDKYQVVSECASKIFSYFTIALDPLVIV